MNTPICDFLREYARKNTLRLHMPLPIEGSQMENVKLLATSIPAKDVAPAEGPLRTVLLEKELAADDIFWAEYEVTNRAPYTDLYALADTEPADRPDNGAVLSDADRAFYLAEQAPHIGFTPFLRGLAARIVKDGAGADDKADLPGRDWFGGHGVRFLDTERAGDGTAARKRAQCLHAVAVFHLRIAHLLSGGCRCFRDSGQIRFVRHGPVQHYGGCAKEVGRADQFLRNGSGNPCFAGLTGSGTGGLCPSAPWRRQLCQLFVNNFDYLLSRC